MSTILVADDLSANRKLLVTILRYQGHRMLEAEDGADALAVARAEHPDLVITDMLMPVMDGYELVRQLGSDPATREIPVVFCTAHYGEREARELALARGVIDVLTKPVEAQALLTVVDRALSGYVRPGPLPEAGLLATAFDQEHLRLMTNKLSETTDHLRAANARLRAVINIGLEFASERDSDRLLSSVCTAVRDLFGATYVTLGIADRSGRTMQLVVSCGSDTAMSLKKGDAVTGILATVMAERRSVRGENPGGDPARLQLPHFHREVRSFLIVPIASPAHVYGWISLVGNEGHPFTEDDESLVVALGGQVGRIYEIGHLGQHDFLTDLPNRMLLNDRVTQAIALARRDRHRLAVLFLDLDRFKRVNDGLGHPTGDLLLQSVARRLVGCVRSSDTVSRHGGDEFVVVIPQTEHRADVAVVAEKIIAALVEPYDIAHQQVYLSGTIGISMYPDDSTDGETLIRYADIAMYHAKKKDPNTYQFFEPEMNALAVERQRIEVSLHQALARREFVLYYQPRINLRTGAIGGAEALIRWNHPGRGLLSPGDFVPIAEDCGLMVPIGRWVVAEACAQARRWIDRGYEPIPVAVNVSAVELRDPQFLKHVGAALRESRLEARFLELELTESALMQHVESAIFALNALKDMGVQVAIDDFGTGYSSLSYLRRFPVTALKIDQSFIHESSEDPAGASIVCAVIDMAKSLGHRVVAEGVETQEQLEFLQARQCDEGQGYFFSRPIVADQFNELLDRGGDIRAAQSQFSETALR